MRNKGRGAEIEQNVATSTAATTASSTDAASTDRRRHRRRQHRRHVQRLCREECCGISHPITPPDHSLHLSRPHVHTALGGRATITRSMLFLWMLLWMLQYRLPRDLAAATAQRRPVSTQPLELPLTQPHVCPPAVCTLHELSMSSACAPVSTARHWLHARFTCSRTDRSSCCARR